MISTEPHAQAQTLDLTHEAIARYLRALPTRGVGKHLSAAELSERFDIALPKEGKSEEELRSDVEKYLEHAVGTLSPHFMNQLFSGLQSWALAGDLLSSVTNTTMATFEASPVATLMERELIRRLNGFVGWSEGDGIMVTGGSNANLVGMLMARNRTLPQLKKTGMSGPALVAFISEEAHYSFDKAANVMGIGSDNLRTVPSDGNGRMIPAELKRAINESRSKGERPFFIGATAGTTVLGEFDPIEELSAIAREENLWLHVDGAWGGSVLTSRTHSHLMKGIEQADSLSWDTHKMLGTGLVSSFFLTRHPQALLSSHAGGGGDYIFHQGEEGTKDLGPSSLQCGRRADAVKVWFAWRALGDEGIERHVDTLFSNAQKAAELIRLMPMFELVHHPRSLNICFRVKGPSTISPERWHRMLREDLMTQGHAMVNMATRKGDSFIRLITAHPNQDAAFIQIFLEQIKCAAERLRP